MKNKDLEQKISNAFEQATPDILDSIMADCKKQPRTMIRFKSNTASWNKKFAISVAAAVLVICFAFGWNLGIFRVGPALPTDPLGTGTQPTDSQPTEPRPTDPQLTEPKPTEPKPTVPQPTEPEPVAPNELPDDLNRDTATVAKFQELFQFGGWYAQALGQYYTQPADMMLRNFLYGVGFQDEPAVTEDERTAIVAMTEIDDYLWMDAKRFPVEKINSLLNEMFGISLDDMSEDALKSMYYLESTDSYYYFNSGSKTADPVKVVGTYMLENGCIELYYQIGQSEADGLNRGYAILEQSGNGYRIVCNLHAGDGAWPEPPPEIPENFPDDLNVNRDVVAKFQKLFDNDSWYTQALREEFDDPRNIGLTDFLFCDMKPWPYTEHTMEETEKLRQQFGITEEWWSDCFSMEAATVEEVLQTVFGYSLAEFKNNSANPYLIYMESTDRYYYGRTDSSLVQNVSVVGIRELDNGNIEVYYTCDWLYPEERVVTLKPVGDSYHILSNKGL